jgi:ATP-dependent Clp protease ATP-binding subunit ClpA
MHHPWVFNLETKHPWKSSGELGLEPYASLKQSPNHSSSSSSGPNTMKNETFPKFKELNAENLKILCNALEKKVPWQKEIIPDIASIILQCRSGMVRRKDSSNKVRAKEDTWLFFQGGDNNGKERIARELASLVFGSHQDNFMLIGAYSSVQSGSTDDDKPTKRAKLEASQVYSERLFEALRGNPRCVVLMDINEQADYLCQMEIKAAIESGMVRSKNGNEVCVGDAIIILSCENFDSRSRACSPQIKRKVEEAKEIEGEDSGCSSLDLNLSMVDEMECSFHDIDLLKAVDRALFFRLLEDSSCN